MADTCRICGERQRIRNFAVREMLLGIGDEHLYLECGNCGTIQIQAPPADMEVYYGERYYQLIDSGSESFPGWALSMDMSIISQHIPFLGRSASSVRTTSPRTTWETAQQKIARHAVEFYLPELAQRPDWRVLDVGCASGAFISVLRDIGFAGVRGVDPHIEASIVHPNGTVVRKGTLESERQTWDVIMFNHSFEHIADPLNTLSTVASLLSPEGICLIRIPKVPNEAWNVYGPKWVQLDAPRHFFIHRADTLVLRAERAGLRHVRTVDDSGIFQFVGSEQYSKGIPYSHRTFQSLKKMTLDRARVRRLAMKALSLNREGMGDQASFVFHAI